MEFKSLLAAQAGELANLLAVPIIQGSEKAVEMPGLKEAYGEPRSRTKWYEFVTHGQSVIRAAISNILGCLSVSLGATTQATVTALATSYRAIEAQHRRISDYGGR